MVMFDVLALGWILLSDAGGTKFPGLCDFYPSCDAGILRPVGSVEFKRVSGGSASTQQPLVQIKWLGSSVFLTSLYCAHYGYV